MRRMVFCTLGILESLVAVVLVVFAWELPGPAEVHDTFGRLERVGQGAGEQVERVREQFHTLRERRPQLQALATRLQEEMRVVNDNLRNQKIDYQSVQAMSDGLGDAAAGLDGLAEALDPEGIGQVGAGLKETADFLDKQVAPAAALAAGELDRTTADLRTDAQHLGTLLKEAPPDLKAARDIHASLGRFDEGLRRMGGLLEPKRIDTMREGFQGLEDSLNTGAEQVERLAGYTYPLVTFVGLKPIVEQKPFWPEGAKIAEGMRKAAKGATEASNQLDALRKDLPALRQSLDESRKVASATRDAIGTALKQQEKVEALLASVPRHTARLAEQLPQLAASLSKILHDTGRLEDVARLLRKAGKGVDAAVERWPALRKDLGRSAALLRRTQTQMKEVVEHRSEYEASLNHTLVLSRTISEALPLLTAQLELELGEQEEALSNLHASLDEVNDALPACSRTASRILQTTRLLLALVAAIFALHGIHLVLSSRSSAKSEPKASA